MSQPPPPNRLGEDDFANPVSDVTHILSDQPTDALTTTPSSDCDTGGVNHGQYSCLVGHLKQKTFAQLWDIFFDHTNSDVRQSRQGKVFKSDKDHSAGTCYTQPLARNSCSSNWGTNAHPHGCSADTVYSSSNPDRKFTNEWHRRMDMECGATDFCEVLLCYKADTSSKLRYVKAANIPYAPDMSVTAHTNVYCGVRSKITICPLVNGTVNECVVKKSCGEAYNPTMVTSGKPKGVWVTDSSGAGFRAPDEAGAFATVKETANFQRMMSNTCAHYCSVA